jgi:two-component system, NarL family, response regulator NreC
MDSKPIRVLLADDHNVLREGLRSLLEREPDIQVVGEAADGRSAVRLFEELAPDVVVMDIGMPELNGIEATRHITSDLFGAKVICLSVHEDAATVHAMLQAGASGYLLKTSAGEELVRGIRAVDSGAVYLSPPVSRQILERGVWGKGGSCPGAFQLLTPREREVLQLIAEGHRTKEAAKRLGIRPKTVLAHRDNIMKKLGVHSVAGLVRYALQEGIAEL